MGNDRRRSGWLYLYVSAAFLLAAVASSKVATGGNGIISIISSSNSSSSSSSSSVCNGTIGDCLGDDEDLFSMEFEVSRRILAGNYISTRTNNRDQSACNNPGGYSKDGCLGPKDALKRRTDPYRDQ